jgi:Putative zinc-finger
MNEFQHQEHNDDCVDLSVLIARRDHELSVNEVAQVEQHLTTCGDCAADDRLINSSGSEVYTLLSTLDPDPGALPDPVAAHAKLEARLSETAQPRKSVPVGAGEGEPRPYGKKTTRIWRQLRRNWVAAVAAAVLLALLILPNASVFADQFLSLFRVQQFQPVSINPREIASHPLPGIQDFGTWQIAANSLKVQDGLSKVQAQRLVTFHVVQPGNLPQGLNQNPTFAVLTGGQLTFTFSAAKTHAYLVRNGHGNMSIPANLDGAKFTVSVASGVEMNYGSRDKDFLVIEIPGPTIRAASSASLNELRDFMLSLPNLPPQLVAQLRQIDLNSGTIPIPVPPQMTAQRVTVHGASGLLLADNTPIGGVLVWQTHGMIYALGGNIGNAAQLLAAANTIP